MEDLPEGGRKKVINAGCHQHVHADLCQRRSYGVRGSGSLWNLPRRICSATLACTFSRPGSGKRTVQQGTAGTAHLTGFTDNAFIYKALPAWEIRVPEFHLSKENR